MKKITKEEGLKEAHAILDIYQTKLGLSEWTITIKYDNDDDETYATVNFDSDDYKVATMSITSEFLKLNARERFQTIIHELFHIVLQPVIENFKTIIDSNSKLIAKIAKAKEEEVTEHLARNYCKNERLKY